MEYLNVQEKNANDVKGAKLPGVRRMKDAMWVLVSCSEFRFNR